MTKNSSLSFMIDGAKYGVIRYGNVMVQDEMVLNMVLKEMVLKHGVICHGNVMVQDEMVLNIVLKEMVLKHGVICHENVMVQDEMALNMVLKEMALKHGVIRHGNVMVQDEMVLKHGVIRLKRRRYYTAFWGGVVPPCAFSWVRVQLSARWVRVQRTSGGGCDGSKAAGRGE